MKNKPLLIQRTCPKKVGDDFFPTPPEVTQELLNHFTFEGEIWECACGDGAISKVLEANGYTNIYSSDLVNRGYGEYDKDFLLLNNRKCENIITNPPFKNAADFMEKALELATKKVAMLMPIRYLTSKVRTDIFNKYPLHAILIIPYKIDFTGSNNPRDEAAWFVWDKSTKEQRILHGAWKK
jgi:hypothetical protein